MKNLILIGLLLFAGCKKPDNTVPIASPDNKLYGYWQVDSITNIYGDNVRTSQMDTLFGPKINPEAQIVMFLSEDSIATSSGYHYGIVGRWSTQSAMGVHFDLKEIVDFANRPKSDWQPLVISAFNDTKTYRMDVEGSKNSQLLLYFADGNAVIFCTKK